MKTRPIMFGVILCMAPVGTIQAHGISPSYEQGMHTGELRARAKRRDVEAILVLGLRSDAASVALLREISSMAVPTETELKALLHVSSLNNPRDKDWIASDAAMYSVRYHDASFAAKAALTRMGTDDYLNDFLVELSTSNFEWKKEIIQELGYIGDPRAIRYLGPLLADDRSSSIPGHEHDFGLTIANAASEALGQILQPPFMDIQARNPGRTYSFQQQWKTWWKENNAQYSDPAFLSSLRAAKGSHLGATQVNVLRQTERKDEIDIGSSDPGDSRAHIDMVTVEFPNPGGTVLTFDVVMVITNSSNLFFWDVQPSGQTHGNALQTFLSTHKLYAVKDKIVDFSLKGTSAFVREERGHQKTFDDALTVAIAEIQRDISAKGSVQLVSQAVGLWDALGGSFFLSGKVFQETHLSAVSQRDSRWFVELSGVDNAKALITLDSNYKIVSASINDKAVFPK